MDERPLFQNTDEQEAAYAPQETADEGAQAAALAEEGTLGENRAASGAGDDAGVLPIPGPGASGALHNTGQASSSGAAPVVGAAGTGDDERRRDI